MHSFIAQLPRLTEPHEFHGDKTPLSSDETPFNDPVKLSILLI